MKRQLSSIAAAALALPIVVAFSLSSAAITGRGASVSSTALKYRNYDFDPNLHLYDVDGERLVSEKRMLVAGTAHEVARSRKRRRGAVRHVDYGYGRHLYDSDSDRTSLSMLLEPPAPPLPPRANSTVVLQTPQERQASLRASSRSRGAEPRQRPNSPIISLYTIQDYKDNVLNAPNAENELRIVRFKAPWCQTCRTTNVAWERMASKLTKLSSSSPKHKVKFLSVELDGKEGTTALKDLLGIEGVPQGVLHLPGLGISEERVKLHRPNLSVLRRNLERYCTFTRGEDGLQSGMLLDGLREE